MLRAVGLAVSLVVGVAAPAAANHSGHDATGVAVTARQGAIIPGHRPPAAGQSTPAQLTTGWARAYSFLHGPMAGLRREAVDQPTGLAVLAPERREKAGSPALPWVSPEMSGLGLPVSERLSLGFAYQHVEGEDRWRPYGEAGPVDYDSHDFLLRAAWRF
jgi:hypothetical protein